MDLSRRAFLGKSALAVTALASRGLVARELGRAGIRVAGCDWSMRQEGNPASFALAKECGLDGVQVSCGKGKDSLPISDPERQKLFIAESEKHGVKISSTCLEILHRDGLKNSPLGPKWVEEAIAPTKALGGRVILLPFFGKQAIKERAEQKAVAERLKQIAPVAEKAGIVLGLENTISAEENAWILDQVGSSAVKVYYDVGNSTSGGFDVYKEVPWLGKDRLAEFHLKDGRNLLGKGKIDFPKFLDAILKSGFEGWTCLETAVVTSVQQDFAANAAYVKGLLKG